MKPLLRFHLLLPKLVEPLPFAGENIFLPEMKQTMSLEDPFQPRKDPTS